MGLVGLAVRTKVAKLPIRAILAILAISVDFGNLANKGTI